MTILPATGRFRFRAALALGLAAALAASGCATGTAGSGEPDSFSRLFRRPASRKAPRAKPAFAPLQTAAGEAEAATRPAGMPMAYPGVEIISPFGVVRGNGKRHMGIDLKAPPGTPVYATADGKVTFSGWQGAYGHLVVVQHDGAYATAYGHLRERDVDMGDDVRRGDLIGEVGRTGNATTEHVHYEVRLRNAPVDPAPYIGPGQ